jgi:PAS domain S-box-containing protein
MSSIRSFLARADRDERPARFIEAILRESSLTVVVRDHRGRFVEYNPQFLEAAGVAPDESGERGERIHHFDSDGRELSLLETPASVARMTGNPQLSTLFGIRYPNGEERWLKGDMLPLERGPEGWAVLGISADVTDLYTERREAQQRVRMLETVLELARRLSHVRLAPAAAATASAVPLERTLPDASLSIAIRQGDVLLLWSIASQSETGGAPRRMQFRHEIAKHWQQEVHVNLNVRDTDIYGDSAVGALDRPYRSIVGASLWREDGRPVGKLVATSPLPNAFSALDIETMKEAARIIGPVIDLSAQAEAA